PALCGRRSERTNPWRLPGLHRVHSLGHRRVRRHNAGRQSPRPAHADRRRRSHSTQLARHLDDASLRCERGTDYFPDFLPRPAQEITAECHPGAERGSVRTPLAETENSDRLRYLKISAKKSFIASQERLSAFSL